MRGKTLRLDLLTPLKRGQTSTVIIKRINAASQPLKYLDLIKSPITAVMLAGTPCLVMVSQPARFALHKLIFSQEHRATNKQKDLLQMHEILSLLTEDRPGDVMLAWEALDKRGARWVRKARDGYGEAAKTHGVITLMTYLMKNTPT